MADSVITRQIIFGLPCIFFFIYRCVCAGGLGETQAFGWVSVKKEERV